MSNAIKHCQDDTDQPIFKYYEKWIFEANEKLNRKLDSEVPRLKIYKGKKRAHTDHIWPLFHIMDDQQIDVTLMTDSTDFLLLDNHDININSFYGDLKQLKNETRKLQADKEKEEVLEDSKTKKTKPNQLLEELKTLVKADITEIG